MRKLLVLCIFLVGIMLSAFVSAGNIFIDFESFNEFDNVSVINSYVKFYMTDFQPLKTLNIGDFASLGFSGRYPMVAEPNTKKANTPTEYLNIVAWTVGGALLDDVVVSDPQSTGASGKTLSDPQTAKDYNGNPIPPLMRHAYSNYEAIVIDVSNLPGTVQGINFAMIDLDHNEDWYILYFDKDNKLIHKVQASEHTWGYGDGAAYPVYYNNTVSAVVVWGENNQNVPEIVGYAIDNIEIEVEEEVCEDYTVDLIAGGGNPKSAIDVGQVTVSSDGETLKVTYQTEDGWEITETHLHVACDLEDIPQTQPNKKGLGGGNPIPGHFDYNNNFDPAVTKHTVTINLDDLCCTDPVIAAHAVVRETTCDRTGEVYGMQRYTGTVYGVDVTSGNSWIEFDTSPPPNAGSATPNGLAYDAINDRFYYCDYYSPNILYLWDTAQHVAGTLIGNVADADFYNGKYYYISGPPASDDLYVVEFNIGGTIKTGFPQKIADIANNTHGWTFNGDIAVKNNVVYGWGRCSTHGFEFFTYDLGTGVFNVVTTTYQQSLQLAFGSDGNLYGHRSGGAGAWYQVNVIDGSVTLISSPGVLFTDAASGELCIPKTETAWGEGDNFPGKNWAMYFSYDLSDCYEPQCLESDTITGAAVTSLTSQTTWLGLISIVSIIALAVVSVVSMKKK